MTALVRQHETVMALCDTRFHAQPHPIKSVWRVPRSLPGTRRWEGSDTMPSLVPPVGDSVLPSPPPAPSATPSSSLLPRILWLTLPSQPLRSFRMRSQRKLALNPTHSAQCFGGQLWWGFLKAHLDLTKAAFPGPRALDVSVRSLWKAPFWNSERQPGGRWRQPLG